MKIPSKLKTEQQKLKEELNQHLEATNEYIEEPAQQKFESYSNITPSNKHFEFKMTKIQKVIYTVICILTVISFIFQYVNYISVSTSPLGFKVIQAIFNEIHMIILTILFPIITKVINRRRYAV